MYGTVARVAEAFDAAQWDPARHKPGTSIVTTWLEGWSKTLDGEIGHVVVTPVDPSTSPNLHAVCEQVTLLRVRADVYDMAFGPSKDGAAPERQSKVWRGLAAQLVTAIQRGATADGTAVSGGLSNRPGSASGAFGSGSFRMDDQF